MFVMYSSVVEFWGIPFFPFPTCFCGPLPLISVFGCFVPFTIFSCFSPSVVLPSLLIFSSFSCCWCMLLLFLVCWGSFSWFVEGFFVFWKGVCVCVGVISVVCVLLAFFLVFFLVFFLFSFLFVVGLAFGLLVLLLCYLLLSLCFLSLA